jgi:hypothetical protein
MPYTRERTREVVKRRARPEDADPLRRVLRAAAEGAEDQDVSRWLRALADSPGAGGCTPTRPARPRPRKRPVANM